MHEATLTRANLKGANLVDVTLTGTDLHEVTLTGANLKGANLKGADLSGATLVEMPRTNRRTKGIEIGVNGIWSKKTDSAALMTLTPPGNSMLAANPDAVIESLKRARRLHGLSFGLAVLALCVLFLKLTEIPIPSLESLKLSPETFTPLALIVSTCVVTLVKSLMDDAVTGARYLQDRASAMQVGNFPWALSRYTGRRLDRRLQSLLTRLVMAFHPTVYIFLYSTPPAWYYWAALGAILLVFCTWIFIISQQFQRPILFDRETEEKRQSEVEKQTAKLTELIDLLKPETAEPEAPSPSDEDAT